MNAPVRQCLMKEKLRSFLRRLRWGGPRSESLDAGTAAAERHHTENLNPGPSYPPGYVKDYDEGRPKH